MGIENPFFPTNENDDKEKPAVDEQKAENTPGEMKESVGKLSNLYKDKDPEKISQHTGPLRDSLKEETIARIEGMKKKPDDEDFGEKKKAA